MIWIRWDLAKFVNVVCFETLQPSFPRIPLSKPFTDSNRNNRKDEKRERERERERESRGEENAMKEDNGDEIDDR